MFRKIFLLLACCSVQLAFADNPGFVTALDASTDATNAAAPAVADISSADPAASNILPALAGGLNADNLQQCIAQSNQKCQSLTTWEQKNACTEAALNLNPTMCGQTLAIYEKLGMLPYKVQAIGPVVVFTLLHIGDGQQTFHIVDKTGALIDLVDDQNPAIAASAQFQKIQKTNPGAGLMQLVAGKPSESPEVVMPKQLANKKDEEALQLIFPQYVKLPPCLACQTIAVADIDYQFSYPEGKFLNVKWLKTVASNTQPDVMDKD